MEEVGLDRVIEQLVADQKGKKKMLSRLVSQLSATDRAELKRRLEQSES